jgi:hypothetical protein
MHRRLIQGGLVPSETLGGRSGVNIPLSAYFGNSRCVDVHYHHTLFKVEFWKEKTRESYVYVGLIYRSVLAFKQRLSSCFSGGRK